LALVPVPISMNGEPVPGNFVAIPEGSVIAQSRGTCRTIKEGAEGTAIEAFQRKVSFLPPSLADVGERSGAAIPAPRPPFVWDINQNGCDTQQPGVGGLLYCANNTCVKSPFVLTQFTMKDDFPSFLKLFQLKSDRDITLEELVQMDKCVRVSINIPARFRNFLIFPVEWNYGWDMVDREEVCDGAYMVACRCRWGRENHRNNQK
jgi:hypothetical protein